MDIADAKEATLMKEIFLGLNIFVRKVSANIVNVKMKIETLMKSDASIKKEKTASIINNIRHSGLFSKIFIINP